MEAPFANAGDIVGLTGGLKTEINHTLNIKGQTTRIPAVKVDPPMLMVEVTVNNSPLSGGAGSINSFHELTSVFRKEADSDIALQCKFESTSILVSGRGDLHLGVLFERLRRNGYEMEVSAPVIVTKKENGKTLDPIELLTIEADEKHVPYLMERILNRGGTVTDVVYDKASGKQK